MNRKEPIRAMIAALVVGGLFVTTQFEGRAQTHRRVSVASRTASPNPSQGLAAMDAAARDGQYLFVFFWKANDKQTQTMRGVFQSALNQWAGSVSSISVRITDPSEKPVVDKLGVRRAPMPLVVALAPSGAVTKAFPIRFTEQQLEEAFVSPGTAKCMKALQDRKLVLVCVQNEKTEFSQAALQGARSFKADVRYAKATEVITLNPEDQAETAFLRDLKVDPYTPQAVTVVLAPPGKPVATFVGAVTKEQIIAKVQAGPCAGGKCGPGGCCPKK